MSFLAPAAFGLFLPLIALLYWRHRKREETRIDVGSLGVWRQVLAETSSPKRRSPISWEMILEFLIGAMLITALAKPVVSHDELPFELWVDRGPAMATAPRVQELEDTLRREAPGRSFRRRLVPFGESSEQGTSAVDWSTTLSAARSNPNEVWLAIDAGQGISDESIACTLVGLKAPIKNVGIVAAELVATKTGSTLYFALARSSSYRRPQVVVEVTTNTSSKQETLSFSDGSRIETELAFSVGTTKAQLRILGDDAMVADDAVTLGATTSSLRMAPDLLVVQDVALALERIVTVDAALSSHRIEDEEGRGLVFWNESAESVEFGVGQSLSKASLAVFDMAPDLATSRFPIQRFAVPSSAGEVLARLDGQPLVVKTPKALYVGLDPEEVSWKDDPACVTLIRLLMTAAGFSGTDEKLGLFDEGETKGLSGDFGFRPRPAAKRGQDDQSHIVLWLALVFVAGLAVSRFWPTRPR